MYVSASKVHGPEGASAGLSRWEAESEVSHMLVGCEESPPSGVWCVRWHSVLGESQCPRWGHWGFTPLRSCDSYFSGRRAGRQAASHMSMSPLLCVVVWWALLCVLFPMLSESWYVLWVTTSPHDWYGGCDPRSGCCFCFCLFGCFCVFFFLSLPHCLLSQWKWKGVASSSLEVCQEYCLGFWVSKFCWPLQRFQ